MSELHVVVIDQHASRYVEGFDAGVDTYQPTDPGCEESGPPAGAAAGVEADRIRWKVVPGKYRLIDIEYLRQLTVVQRPGPEPRHQVTKRLDDAVIKVSWMIEPVAHVLLIVDSGAGQGDAIPWPPPSRTGGPRLDRVGRWPRRSPPPPRARGPLDRSW